MHRYFNKRNLPNSMEKLVNTVLHSAQSIAHEYNCNLEERWKTVDNKINKVLENSDRKWKGYFLHVWLDRFVEEVGCQLWNTVFKAEGGLSGNVKKAEKQADQAMDKMLKQFK